MGRVLIVFLLLVGLLIYFHLTSERRDLLPGLAGCFRGQGQLANARLAVSPTGEAKIFDQMFSVSVTEDKMGFSFVPSRAVLFDANPPRISVTPAEPLLLRIGPDRRTVTIPGETGDVVLVREACGQDHR